MARAVAEMNAQDIDPTVVKLGDASVASPFTARRTSVDCVLTVLRQGRCTLVTTIQVYKVLALNCLVSAYMMSALYLRGLKQGDMQMTFSGLITAGLFFFLSQAKPLQNLSSSKPPSSVFHKSVAVSVLCQFIIHLSCLVATLHLCESHSTPEEASSADGKFQPNVINSAIFMLSAVMQVNIYIHTYIFIYIYSCVCTYLYLFTYIYINMYLYRHICMTIVFDKGVRLVFIHLRITNEYPYSQVNNFVVNYRGHPFTQSIQENIYLWRSVQVNSAHTY
jgi:magnesium-transporting ATPase (P-type)